MLLLIQHNKFLILWNLVVITGISILLGWSLPSGFFNFPPVMIAGIVFIKLFLAITLPILLVGFLIRSRVESSRVLSVITVLLMVVPLGLVILSMIPLFISTDSLLLQQIIDSFRSSGLIFLFTVDHLLALVAGAEYSNTAIYGVNFISLLIRILISGSIIFLLFPTTSKVSGVKFKTWTWVFLFIILITYIILPYITLAL